MAAGLDFLISIQQKLGGGDVASKLADLEKKIKGEQQALAALERQQKQMEKLSKKDGASMDIAAYDKVRAAIGAKKASLAGLQEQLTNTAAASEKGGSKFGELAGQMKAAAGPAGAIITALIAVATAIAVVVYKLASFALAAADAHRSFLLVMAGATGTVAGATAASAAVDRVAANSAVARVEIEHMAQTLAVAGLKGKLFESTLKTMAAVAAVAGPQAAGKLEEIAKKAAALGKFKIEGDALAGLGISMKDLADQFGLSVTELEARMKAGKISAEAGMDAMNKALNKRFGAVAEQQMLGFSVQIMKLQENLAALFRDVNIEPFLVALKDLLSIFDSSTSSGKALKTVVTAIFSGLFAIVGAVMPYLKAFFQGMIIAALQLYVAVKPIFTAIFGGLGGKPNEGLIKFFVMLGKFAAYVVIGLAALVAFIMSTFAPAFVAASAFVGGLVAAIGLILGAIGAVVVGLISGIGSMVSRISGGAKAASGAVKGAFSGIGEWLQARFGKPIAAIQSGFARVAGAIGALFSTIAGVVGGVLGIIGAAVMERLAPVLAFLSEAWSTISGAASAAWTAIVDTVSGASSAVWGYLSGLFAPLAELDLAGIAANLINGFVDGIVSNIGLAVAAIQSLGSAVMGGLQSLLGIHSPSTVFRGFGGFTAEGFTEGVEAGAPAAKGAVNKMVDLPKGAAAGGGRRGGARAVQLAENLTLVALDPEELWAMLETKVTSLFEAAENAGEGAPA